jgi:hypothetical protein
MKEENQVYVQLGYDESLESKKEILSSEISLLNLMKIIKRFNILKLEELKIKSKIRREIKLLGIKTREVQSSFPFLKISPKIKHSSLNEERPQEIKEKFDENIESQLREIQEKLREINRR